MDKSIHEGTDERTNTTNERNRLPSFARAFLVSRFSSLVLLLFLLFFFFLLFFYFYFFLIFFLFSPSFFLPSSGSAAFWRLTFAIWRLASSATPDPVRPALLCQLPVASCQLPPRFVRPLPLPLPLPELSRKIEHGRTDAGGRAGPRYSRGQQ